MDDRGRTGGELRMTPTPRDDSRSLGERGGVADAMLRELVTSREAAFASVQAQLRAAVATVCGFGHDVNEDCASALDSASSLFVVADGVGGGAHASYASQALVTRLHAALDRVPARHETLRAALREADQAIARGIAERSEATGAATVALCQAMDPSLARWLVAWVGDCRVYQLGAQDAAARPLTVDDSYRRLGEEPPHGGSPDDPARMVGNGAIDMANVREASLPDCGMLVLCSDGVHRQVSCEDLARLLHGALPLARRCEALIDFARQQGSRDDATVLVIEHIGASPVPSVNRGSS
jgi:protein phosphatase